MEKYQQSLNVLEIILKNILNIKHIKNSLMILKKFKLRR